MGTSPVTLIPKAKLHLVYQLGVMKNILEMWVERGLDKVEFDARIREFPRTFPQEINRNERSISDLCRWKAT